jgi:hypothetical protein
MVLNQAPQHIGNTVFFREYILHGIEYFNKYFDLVI